MRTTERTEVSAEQTAREEDLIERVHGLVRRMRADPRLQEADAGARHGTCTPSCGRCG